MTWPSMKLRRSILSFTGASLIACAKAATIQFTPDQLSDFQMTGSLVYQDDGGMASSVMTDPSIESPNRLRFETLITGGGQAVYTHEWLGATITPSSQGAITSIDFSVELSDPSLGDTDTSLFFGLVQDSMLYFYTANGDVIRSFRPDENDSSIEQHSVSDLSSANFGRFTPGPTGNVLNIDAADNPDFSGSEIRFVYGTFSGTDTSNFNRFVDVQSSDLIVRTIPEPKPSMLLALALLGIWRRRVSRRG